jgi:hypothetical protein
MAEPNYDPNRKNRTWREVHGSTAKEKAGRESRAKQKKLNRKPGYFGKAHWNAYQHDQLYDMIMTANLEKMSNRAEQWKNLAGRIEVTTSDVERVMERLMGAWRGSAAVNAAAANSRLMQWAGDAGHTATKIAKGMSDYTDAVGEAQTRMPPPAFASAERNFRNGYTVTGTGGPSTAILLRELLSDGIVSHEAARARKAEAVEVMEAYERQSKDVHDSMPQFTGAPPTTAPPGSEPPATPPYYDGPHWSPGPVETPPDSWQDAGSDTGTTAAGFADPTRGTPALGGGSGAGSLGGLGGGGADVVRGGPTPGGPAGGVAGVGGIPARGPGSLGSGVLPGARGGMGAGAFGGMPIGHGAGGEDDKEHKNKYDEGLDLFDDLPPAYPPVFGA